jgi:hypothetical protein
MSLHLRAANVQVSCIEKVLKEERERERERERGAMQSQLKLFTALREILACLPLHFVN